MITNLESHNTMGKYILATGVDRFFGSRGGATFQKTGTVFSIRKRAVPVQKKTPKQSVSKNRFESVQGIYRTLSPTEKASFNSETVNYPRENSLEETYFLSGQQLMSSSNNNLEAAGETPITSMPSPVVFPGISFLDAQIVISILEATSVTNPAVIPAGFTFVIESTDAFQTEQNFVNSPFIRIATIPAGTQTDDVNWFEEWKARFGDPSNRIGQIFSQRGWLISHDTGQAGLIAVIRGEIFA